MSRRIKVFSILGLVFTILNGYSQVGSPYSQYGMGDNSFRGYEQNKAMGGIGFGLQSNSNLNSLNPASYSALDSLSVIYAVGFNSGFNYIESAVDNVVRSDTRFGYFALGFKGSSFWASSIGITPLTQVDYTYKTAEATEENGDIDYYLHGSGGLSKLYWGNSFAINENLYLGVNASYVFGAINKVSTVVFKEDVSNADNTKMDKQTNIYDFTFDFGAQYKVDINKKSQFILGATYAPKTNMKSKKSVLAGTVKNTDQLEDEHYKEIFVDDLLTVAIDTSDIKGELELPSAFGVGFTYFYKQKLLLGADFYHQAWSSIENDFHNASYNNLISVKGGLEYTPDFNSINYYYKKIKYRLGGHFTQTHMVVKGTQINDYGVSFGLGLPMRNRTTSFNVSCELGQKGTLEQNLLRETYAIISLNISLSDIWFKKRKFN